MRASEKMSRRVTLVTALTNTDIELKLALGMQPCNRATTAAMNLLNRRNTICRDMQQVGYEPWPSPINLDESRVP
ncbi:hypothetical protein [Mycobacterium phage WXIN]|nr:hypothetical protein [Mycobacterium phage WXIN]